jgi:hypothetical protein
MPFGKHRGKPVAELPLGYLRWLVDNVDLREPLLSAVEAVVNGGPLPCELDQDTEDRINEIIKSWDGGHGK